MKYQLEEGCRRVNKEIDKMVPDTKDRDKERLDSTTLSRCLNGPSEIRKEAIRRVYGEDAGACKDFKAEADRLAAELGRVKMGWIWPEFKTALIIFCTIFTLVFGILTPFYIDDVGRVVESYGADKLREEKALHKYMMRSKDREIEALENLYNQAMDDKKIITYFFLDTDEKRKNFDNFLSEEDIDY